MKRPNHDPDTMLEAILVGDRSESDPDVRAALEASPALRERLARLRALGDELDSAGRAAFDSVERELARREWTPRNVVDVAGARPRRWPWLLLLAAAAVAVAAISWWAFTPGERAVGEGRGLYLGFTESMQPQHDYGPDQVFSWNAIELPVGASCYLRIYDAEDVDMEDPLIEVRVDGEGTWSPTEAERSRFPSAMIWALVVDDGLGNELPRGSRRVVRR